MLFQEKLEAAGMTKAELARRLGINPNTVSAWREGCPKYAEAFLDAVIEKQKVESDLCECLTAVKVIKQTEKGTA